MFISLRSSQSFSILSIHDDMGMHVPDSLKQEIMKGEFTELHIFFNKQNDSEAY